MPEPQVFDPLPDEAYEVDTAVRLRDVAEKPHVTDDGWVEVPYTTLNPYGETDVTMESNHRSLLRAYEDNDEVTVDAGTIYFAADTTDTDLIETYNALMSYPIFDEDDESELRMERESEAWDDWARDDFYRALDAQFPLVAEGGGFDEFVPPEGAAAVFFEMEPQWEHTSDGTWLNVGDMLERRVQYRGADEVLGEVGGAIFYDQAWNAKRALTEFLGFKYPPTDDQLMLLINVLWDLGYQARNAPGTGLEPDDIETNLASQPPVPGLIALFDADPEAEVWYQYLAERWVAFTALRDEAALAGSEGEESFVEFLREAQPYLEAEDPVEYAEAHGLIGMTDGRTTR
ncbi:MAG: hypothetical protein GY769_20075 [bacterium]|nr:hypothetical protein [bacterium]